MAIYHESIKYISRRKGQAAIPAAAYRSGERLHDEYYGSSHDYTQKRGIVHTEIYLPPTAPREFYDRQTLWNAVEEAEKRKDSRLAREVEISLPVELSLTDQVQLVEDYVTTYFVDKGMCADVCVHDKGVGNPHAHILLTTRHVNEDGFGKKNRDWDKKSNARLWRREWANIQNREFERMGLEVSVSHESYIARGIDREPTLHLGYRVKELERNGIETDRSNENRAILIRNRERAEREIQRIERKRGRSREWER